MMSLREMWFDLELGLQRIGVFGRESTLAFCVTGPLRASPFNSTKQLRVSMNPTCPSMRVLDYFHWRWSLPESQPQYMDIYTYIYIYIYIYMFQAVDPPPPPPPPPPNPPLWWWGAGVVGWWGGGVVGWLGGWVVGWLGCGSELV